MFTSTQYQQGKRALEADNKFYRSKECVPEMKRLTKADLQKIKAGKESEVRKNYILNYGNCEENQFCDENDDSRAEILRDGLPTIFHDFGRYHGYKSYEEVKGIEFDFIEVQHDLF